MIMNLSTSIVKFIYIYMTFAFQSAFFKMYVFIGLYERGAKTGRFDARRNTEVNVD